MPRIPHMNQFGGVWCMEPRAFQLALDIYTPDYLLRHVAAEPEPISGGASYELDRDGVALIDIEGTITKYGSSFGANPGTLQLRRMLRNAAADPKVKSIVLVIDSPGGNFFGTDDLAAQVKQTAERVPVVAFIEDLGASAAYYVASQATHIIANPAALVGSIGSMAVIVDYSKAFEKAGVTAIVIKAGEFKGTGVRGTELTPGQLAEVQREVDQVNGMFLKAVGSGRGLSPEAVQELANGRVEIAAEAIKVGLIDSIGDIEAAIDVAVSLQSRTGRSSLERKTMATDPTTAVQTAGDPPPVATTAAPVQTATPATAAPVVVESPATLQQLMATLPDTSPEFRERCLLDSVTMDVARDRWMQELRKRVTSQQQTIEDTAAAAKKPGVASVGGGVAAGTTSSPLQTFPDLVQKYCDRGMGKRQAMEQAVKEHPQAHKDYVAAYNVQHGRPVPASV